MLRSAFRSVKTNLILLEMLGFTEFPVFPGSEVDLDLGNYERYLALTLTGDNNITTGKIYQHVRMLKATMTATTF